MSEQANQKKRGKNTYLLSHSDIMILPGLNVSEERKDRDIETLKESIRKNGIEEPLKGYYDRDLKKYIIVKGHRRFTAIGELVAEGYDIEIPMFTYSEKPSELQILQAHITSNSGLPLNALEQADVCKRMKDMDIEVTEIAEYFGFTVQSIYNFLKLAESPESLRQLIIDGVISSTAIVSLFKELKDWSQVEERVKALLLKEAGKITVARAAFKAPDDDTEFQETRTAHQRSFAPPKQASFESRVLDLKTELKIKLDDPDYDQQSIEKFIDALDCLQDGNEISVVIDSIFSLSNQSEAEEDEESSEDMTSEETEEDSDEE